MTDTWTVPASDEYDPPHTIALDMSLHGDRLNLALYVQELVTTDEARALAKALVEAADYADRCVVTPCPTQEA